MPKTVKNYPKYYSELQGYMKNLAEASPEVMSAFGKLHQSASKEGSLSSKTKELIALGIAIAVRCDGCIAYHTADALKAGASQEEIAETIAVAVLMGGGPATIYGAQALEALHQFQTQLKDWAAQ